MIDQKRLCIISGPSGAGKTSIYKKLLSEFDWLRYSVSVTTRDARPGEKDGQDYYFLGHERFEQLKNEMAFAEYAQVHGNWYGTLKSELAEKTRPGVLCILDIDVQGAARLRALYPGALKIFVRPPDVATLEKRLMGRSTESPEVRALRVSNAVRELEDEHFFDYSVVNTDFEQAYAQVQEIILQRKGALDNGHSV
ncbi:MAG TPA: guanylate kinase [Spirochaetota bacterium]|nr:guanylate kinase [Spirochaetota bacterium]HPN82203.1 guanylate kinase [Spirochaetota bacterium]